MARKMWILAAVAAAGSFMGGTAMGADPQYKKITEINIGGGTGFDYLTADGDNQRLYVSHSTKVEVVDTKENKLIGSIDNTRGVHGFALAPALKRGFSSNGQANTVSIIDLDSKGADGKPDFKVIGEPVKTGGNPDAIMYDAKSGEVWTCNGRANTFTAFEAKTGKILSDGVALGGKPETGAIDAALNRAFINLEDKNQVVSIDLKEHKVLDHWSLGAASGPTGMAYAPDLKRIIVGASAMVMLDAETGKVVATVPCGRGVDAAAYDPATHLAFVSAGGAGTVTIAKVEADKLTTVQTLTTEAGARTMTVDTKTHRIYLSNRGNGGLKVLVYGMDETPETKPAP